MNLCSVCLVADLLGGKYRDGILQQLRAQSVPQARKIMVDTVRCHSFSLEGTAMHQQSNHLLLHVSIRGIPFVDATSSRL
jgi:hypothetical protein